MIAPYIPPEPENNSSSEPTDFRSLIFGPAEPSALPEMGKGQPTDFTSLRKGIPLQPEVIRYNSGADHFINFCTPFLIFIMSGAVMMYLLNVRWIYTAIHDINLRFFVLCLVLGVVALNRLIARQGSQESVIYVIGLFFAVALYTLATTRTYGVGSVSRNFLNDNIPAALLFNTAIVAGIWWMVNRLTHECCVDESAVAGDIGMFTATADKVRWALQRAAAEPGTGKKAPLKSVDVSEPWHEIKDFDPTENIPSATPRKTVGKTDYSDRLPPRHPGMALFYFSVPVMLVFAFGLRVIQHAGLDAVRMGAFYLCVYVFCSLVLLSMTCLRQLRVYFGARGVAMPPALSWTWLGLSFVMVVLIMWLASVLPLPAMPPAAYVDQQQISAYTPETNRIGLLNVTPPTLTLLERMLFRERLEIGARVFMAVMLLYVFVKILQYVVSLALTKKEKLPSLLAWLITALAWLLFKLWPALFSWTFPRPRVRIQRKVALSSRYDNPLGKPSGERMSTREHVAYAYDALRALSADIGFPPSPSQTPYEFLEQLPEQLNNIREEAGEIVQLYVVAAYSTYEMNARMEDRLRKFWRAFKVVRNYYVR